MNLKWFGDSYDIIKRFFIENLQELGYQIIINPMFTHDLDTLESEFYRFLKVDNEKKQYKSKSALFIDPDTGIGRKKTQKHITIDCIVKKLESYDLIFSFDQSFARNKDSNQQMKEKLELLKRKDSTGFFYDSHARFLFATKSVKILQSVEEQFLSTGLPKSRFLKLED